MNEKRPRHYAAEILLLPTIEQRKEAFERVPEIWKPMTRSHVSAEWERRKLANARNRNR